MENRTSEWFAEGIPMTVSQLQLNAVEDVALEDGFEDTKHEEAPYGKRWSPLLRSCASQHLGLGEYRNRCW